MPDETSHPGVFVDEIPPGAQIKGVETSVTAFAGRTDRGDIMEPLRITSFDDFTRVFGALDPNYPVSYAVRDFYQNGGTSAIVLRLANPGDDGRAKLDVSTYLGGEEEKAGIYALLKTGNFNLFSIPPDTIDGDTAPVVYQAALQLCIQQQAILLVDPPAAWSDADPNKAARNAVNGFDQLGLSGPAARNAALYFPRILEADPKDPKTIRRLVPSGAIAGIFAANDAQRGVWHAPAGTDEALQGIDGIEIDFNDAQQSRLNPMGINLLRTFPAIGSVVWGSRTMRGADILADEYKYIPVLRLRLFIEESLKKGLAWTVFEPNAEPLWAMIRFSVTNFMQGLFLQGAFAGTSSNSAFFVNCDSSTMTRDDINNGIVNIIVGFAPIMPAEFVVISLQQMAGPPPE